MSDHVAGFTFVPSLFGKPGRRPQELCPPEALVAHVTMVPIEVERQVTWRTQEGRRQNFIMGQHEVVSLLTLKHT